jgi:hypothetical protein
MSKYFPLLLGFSLLSISLAHNVISQLSIVVAQVVTKKIAAQTLPNIEGDWKMVVAGESITAGYTIVQKGNILTGTFRAPVGSLPLTGKIAEDRKVNMSAKFGGLKMNLEGTVNGQTITGLIDIPTRGKKKFTATR